jgi:rhodanese-related sulfurtransferase
VRDSKEYSESHIPNAVSVPLESGHSEQSPPKWRSDILFQELGILKNTQVVVYDRIGGRHAAWLWWNLIEAGHPYVASLDGGWMNWVAQGLPISDKIPKIKRTSYQPQELTTEREMAAKPSIEKIRWNWKETVGPEGLKNAETLGRWLRQSGLEGPGCYRLEGSPKEAAYLVFLLKLFGRSGRVQDIENDHFIVRIEAGDQR